MKFLVDPSGDLVRGAYNAPLDFSISGKYVVDVQDGIEVRASTSSVTDLIAAKVSAIKAEHPTLMEHLNDEFLTTSQIDVAASTRIMAGPSKRAMILPGGRLVTTALVIPTAFTSVMAHWYGFRLHSHPGPVTPTPEPPRLLYNHDGTNFITFDPTSFLVELRNSTNTATHVTLSQDVEASFSQATPFTFRLRFTNNAVVPLHLSDWTLLYG